MDALVTNFHLPESTLIMLVSALAGREHVLSRLSRRRCANATASSASATRCLSPDAYESYMHCIYDSIFCIYKHMRRNDAMFQRSSNTEGQGPARQIYQCAHGGEVQTPVFMSVGTQAAIKGGVSAAGPQGASAVRSSCPTPTISICARATTWCAELGGLHKFHALGRPDPDGLRRLPGVLSCGAAQDQGGGCAPLPPTLTVAASSWGRRRACASSPTLAATLRWRSTSAWRIRRPTSTRRTPVSARCAGWSAARQSMTS